MRIRKIVVGTDFSETSRAAIEASLDLARKSGAEMVLVHAAMIPEYDHLELVPRSRWKRALDGLVSAHREQLATLRERYDSQGVEISQLMIDDVPARAILRAAEDQDADLVAVGTRGRSAVTRLLLGSVAKRVARHAKASVLVARPRREGGGFRNRILVPTDFSPSAEQALASAARLVADGGEIDLLHCIRVHSEIAAAWIEAYAVPDAKAVPLGDALVKAAEKNAAALVEKYERSGVTLRSSVVKDLPREGIRSKLANGSYDLVIMGSRGRSGAKRWLLGSVAEATVRHAPCSVLVVREKEWIG